MTPGYAYRRTGGSNDVSVFAEIGSTTVSGHNFQGSFGAQYSLHEKFSVFGEAGLRYLTQQTRSTVSNGGTDFRSFGSRGAVGVIFYFAVRYRRRTPERGPMSGQVIDHEDTRRMEIAWIAIPLVV